VLTLNNIFTLFDWPLPQDEFINYLNERYGSVAAAQAIPVYTTVDGVVMDAASFALLPVAQRAVVTTAYDSELADNEAKRRIQVVPATFVDALVAELKNVMRT
jgi:hypothetical protein